MLTLQDKHGLDVNMAKEFFNMTRNNTLVLGYNSKRNIILPLTISMRNQEESSMDVKFTSIVLNYEEADMYTVFAQSLYRKISSDDVGHSVSELVTDIDRKDLMECLIVYTKALDGGSLFTLIDIVRGEGNSVFLEPNEEISNLNQGGLKNTPLSDLFTIEVKPEVRKELLGLWKKRSGDIFEMSNIILK